MTMRFQKHVILLVQWVIYCGVFLVLLPSSDNKKWSIEAWSPTIVSPTTMIRHNRHRNHWSTGMLNDNYNDGCSYRSGGLSMAQSDDNIDSDNDNKNKNDTVEDDYKNSEFNIQSHRRNHQHGTYNETTAPSSSSSSSRMVPSPRKKNTAAAAERSFRVAQKKTEIDRILNHPTEPIFDVESEMERVASITPPLIQEGTPEYELDQHIYNLEEDLYKAVKQQDYDTAQEKKNQITQVHIDDCGAVLQVNSAFYKAFSGKDIEAMENLWLKDNSCVCIHPSHPPRLGFRSVLDNWKEMFDATNGQFQKSWMEPREIRLAVKGATAIITCEERVYLRRFVRGKKRSSELVNKLTASNIFRKVDGKWYLSYHHASWHADSHAAKAALRIGGGRGFDTTSSLAEKGNDPSPRAARILKRGNNADKTSFPGLDEILESLKGGMKMSDDGTPDIPGLSGGNAKIERVYMGSLSDLLNSKDLLNGNLGGENGKPTIIRFSTNKNKNLDGGLDQLLDNDKDSDDEDDEDDEDEDENDVEDDEDDDDDDDDAADSVSLIKRWATSRSSSPSPMDGSIDITKRFVDNNDDDDDNNNNDGGFTFTADPKKSSLTTAPKDALRQSCIGALRKLSSQGSISAKQKRVLLTDIIKCSAKGEYSMVEVAYELLCFEGEQQDWDDAEEEFADQCRTFAQQLLSESHSNNSENNNYDNKKY